MGRQGFGLILSLGHKIFGDALDTGNTLITEAAEREVWAHKDIEQLGTRWKQEKAAERVIQDSCFSINY